MFHHRYAPPSEYHWTSVMLAYSCQPASRARIWCLRANSNLLVYWFICQRKFSWLLRKSLKLLPPDALILAQNAPKCVWRPGSARTRCGSLQRSPDPLAGFGGPTSKGKGEGREGGGKGGKGREGEGKGGERLWAPQYLEEVYTYDGLGLHNSSQVPTHY